MLLRRLSPRSGLNNSWAKRPIRDDGTAKELDIDRLEEYQYRVYALQKVSEL